MLVCIPNVLDAAQIVSLRERLDRANEAWVDGRVTAGYQGAPVKFNLQVDERSEVAASCQRMCSSISTPDSSTAPGLAMFLPVYFGAVPCVASNIAARSPMFAPAATPSPPVSAAAASEM